MFELKVREEERDGFIYKIMDMDLGNKKEEVYIKLPLSEKQYLTDLYDPYVVFTISKMMSVGGDCIIRGKVSKSLLDNLEIFTSCWNIWVPDRAKPINIIADEEIDEPKKLNNDAVMCLSGGLDSVSTLYRHCNGLAGRNNRNIKKALAIGGGRGNTNTLEKVEKRKLTLETIAKDMRVNIVYIDVNLNQFKTSFYQLEEFIIYYVAIMMLYQDTYNNLIIASDQFINYASINIAGRGSNPITNKLLQSNRFRLITDGELITRIDKINTIKDWNNIFYNIYPCDNITDDNKCCGVCQKCVVTKLDFVFSDANVDLNRIFKNTNIDLNKHKLIGDNYIFYEEMLYYDKYKKKVLDDESRKKIKYLIEENKYPEYVKKIHDLEKSNIFNLLTIFNFKIFAINNNTENITISIFGIKITIKK